MGVGVLTWQSYAYYSHILDKVDDDDPMMANPDTGHMDATQWLCYTQISFADWYDEANAWDRWINRPWEMAQIEDQDCVWSDADLNTLGVPTDQRPIGNGGSNTLYRLREGVERFMITDVNDPAASPWRKAKYRSCGIISQA